MDVPGAYFAGSEKNGREQEKDLRAPAWWALHVLILALFPLLAAGGGAKRAAVGRQVEAALPAGVTPLLIVGTLQVLLFLGLLGLAWVFSRFRAKDLYWGGWRGIETATQGLFYSLAMRIGLGALVALVVLVAMGLGNSREAVEAFLKEQGAGTGRLVSLEAVRNPAYLVVLSSFISFGVAGLCEELWRAGMLAGLIRLMPPRWSAGFRLALALLFSSCLFGAGHVVQGPLAILLTAALGVVLGAIMLRHNSIWPAVMAHGFFNATSFLMVAMAPAKIS